MVNVETLDRLAWKNRQMCEDRQGREREDDEEGWKDEDTTVMGKRTTKRVRKLG